MLTFPPVPGLTRDPAFLIQVAEGAGPRVKPGAGEGA